MERLAGERRLKRRRRMWIAVFALIAVAAVLIGVWAARDWPSRMPGLGGDPSAQPQQPSGTPNVPAETGGTGDEDRKSVV